MRKVKQVAKTEEALVTGRRQKPGHFVSSAPRFAAVIADRPQRVVAVSFVSHAHQQAAICELDGLAFVWVDVESIERNWLSGLP